jgi:hypothetical protein
MTSLKICIKANLKNLKRNGKKMNKLFSRRCRTRIVILWLLLSASILIPSCSRPAPVFVPLDKNIERIIEARDFDSLLFLYFQSLGKAKYLELKLKECQKGK